MNNPVLWASRRTCPLGQNGQAVPVGSLFPASLVPAGVTPGRVSEVIRLGDAVLTVWTKTGISMSAPPFISLGLWQWTLFNLSFFICKLEIDYNSIPSSSCKDWMRQCRQTRSGIQWTLTSQLASPVQVVVRRIKGMWICSPFRPDSCIPALGVKTTSP